MIFCVDFDGSIVKVTPPGTPLELRPGAREGLLNLAGGLHELVLHSCRSTAPYGLARQIGIPTSEISWEQHRQRYAEMRTFLRQHRLWLKAEGGVFDLVWQWPGKPDADVYLDDRGFSLKHPNAWAEVLATWGA